MRSKRKQHQQRFFIGAVTALALLTTVGITAHRARSSDHADTPEIAASPGADLTDVFVFPSPTNANNVVLAMCVHPLIPTGQAGGVDFDPNVLYQFKIDNTGDFREDLVIQARFTGTGSNQQVIIAGPTAPAVQGTQSIALPGNGTGFKNQPFTTPNGLQVFAGAREDPFFFDLEQFFTILPDRATPVYGTPVPVADANKPQATTWRAPGVAKDFLIGFNLLAIVVELPKSQVRGATSGKINVWCTTSR